MIVGAELDHDRAVGWLTTALQTVSDPNAYASTGDHIDRRARAALAERAKAMSGLMLFMIEGLIRARVRAREKGICHVPSVVHNAWLRWLQLNGRRAGVVVPMDGWLVAAFPALLLTRDTDLIDQIACTEAIGVGISRKSTLRIPMQFLFPATLFGDWLGIPELGQQIANLIGMEPEARRGMDPRARWDRATPLPPSPVAERLIADLVSDLTGDQRADLSNYPGH